MTHKQHRPPFLRHALHPSQALLLESGISHRKHFIHDQDLRLQVGGDGECEPHVHPGGVAFHRCVYELLHLGKGHNFVKLTFDLCLLHTQDGAV